MNDLVLQSAFGFVVLLLVWILPWSPKVRFATAVGLLLIALMPLGAAVTTAARLLSFVCLAALVYGVRARSRSSKIHHIPGERLFVTVVYFCIFAIQVATTVYGRNLNGLMDLAAITLGLATGLLIIEARRSFDLLPVTLLVLALSLIASLAYALINPGTAVVQGRLAGVYANANSLGLVSFLTLAGSLLSTKRLAFRVPIVAISAIALVASGSRASLGATAIAVMIIVFSVKGIRRRLVTGLIVIAVSIALVSQWEYLSSLEIFRETASRGGWPWAFDTIRANFPYGMGDTIIHDRWRDWSVESFVASSPLVAAVWAGLIGMCLVGVEYITFLLYALRIDRKAAVLAIAAIGHSLFESWFVVGASPMMLLVLVMLNAVVTRDLSGADRFGDAVDSIDETKKV